MTMNFFPVFSSNERTMPNHWSLVIKRDFHPSRHPGRPRPLLSRASGRVWELNTIQEDTTSEEERTKAAEAKMLDQIRASSGLWTATSLCEKEGLMLPLPHQVTQYASPRKPHRQEAETKPALEMEEPNRHGHDDDNNRESSFKMNQALVSFLADRQRARRLATMSAALTFTRKRHSRGKVRSLTWNKHPCNKVARCRQEANNHRGRGLGRHASGKISTTAKAKRSRSIKRRAGIRSAWV